MQIGTNSNLNFVRFKFKLKKLIQKNIYLYINILLLTNKYLLWDSFSGTYF